MKFPVIEPLRRNGKKILPPDPVELDPEQDAAEIDHLVARCVIEDVRDKGSDEEQSQTADDVKNASGAAGQAQPKKALAPKAAAKKKATPKAALKTGQKAVSEPASAATGSGDADSQTAKD
jgi:hypothetical protein